MNEQADALLEAAIATAVNAQPLIGEAPHERIAGTLVATAIQHLEDARQCLRGDVPEGLQ